MSGVERIAAERKRQIEKLGYTPEHDDQHTIGALANAASSYLTAAVIGAFDEPPILWPWKKDDWRPSFESGRNLEKAGALIAAALDRLERLEDADGA